MPEGGKKKATHLKLEEQTGIKMSPKSSKNQQGKGEARERAGVSKCRETKKKSGVKEFVMGGERTGGWKKN